MDADQNIGRQILLNANRSMKHEFAAFVYLKAQGLNEGEVKRALRRVGVFTKIRFGKVGK